MQKKLQFLGVKMMFEVDATSLIKGSSKDSLDIMTASGAKEFRTIVFNFPETGHSESLGSIDEDTAAEANSNLLKAFFRQARRVLTEDGQVELLLLSGTRQCITSQRGSTQVTAS